jgi:Cys-tRNA(Pro)/Cys-tRNA(Cys) deacylase
MTPAILLARKKGITHEIHGYAHDPAEPSYGLEAAQKLGIESERVFKTLVVDLDSTELVVAILPVTAMLGMKQIARCAGARKATLADRAAVERATGYVLGGVSPLAQKKRLRTFIDATALEFRTVFVSAGRRGLELELSPEDLVQLVAGSFADLNQPANPGP